MRLHTNLLDATHLSRACFYAEQMVPEHGEVFMSMGLRGSKSRKRAFDLRLTGDGTYSKRRVNSGNQGAGDEFACTWEQWGWALAFLFDIDPKTRVSTGHAYDGFDDYHAKTKGKFLLTDTLSRAVLVEQWEVMRTLIEDNNERWGWGIYMPRTPYRILREEGY